jgi:hypothetical protein
MVSSGNGNIYIQIMPGKTWQNGFRPTKMRVLIWTSEPLVLGYIQLRNSNGGDICYQANVSVSAGWTSLEYNCTFTSYNIVTFQINDWVDPAGATGKIRLANIEFF